MPEYPTPPQPGAEPLVWSAARALGTVPIRGRLVAVELRCERRLVSQRQAAAGARLELQLRLCVAPGPLPPTPVFPVSERPTGAAAPPAGGDCGAVVVHLAG